MEKALLKIVSERTRQIEPDSLKSVTLRAAPYVDYLKNFSRVAWDPMLMGLEPVGHGRRSTLVACPSWALQWLSKIDCFLKEPGIFSFFHNLDDRVWTHFADCPPELEIASSFTQAGGFVNCWMSDETTHMVWGRVDPRSSTSLLCFAWLQHVLAGGKEWSRREIECWPPTVQDVLPLGYMKLHGKEALIEFASLGAYKPLCRWVDGRWGNACAWLGMPDNCIKARKNELDLIVWPQVESRPLEGFFWNDMAGYFSPAMRWKLGKTPCPDFMEFSRVRDGLTGELQWKARREWVQSAAQGITRERAHELELCLKEILLLVERKAHEQRWRMMICMRKESAPDRLHIRITLPTGKGCFGKEGFRLTESLSGGVRVHGGGNEMEFEFHYTTVA